MCTSITSVVLYMEEEKALKKNLGGVEKLGKEFNLPLLWECFYALENIVASNPEAAGDRARAALLAMWRQQGNEDVDMPESTWGQQ